jgi:hypothetical protein
MSLHFNNAYGVHHYLENCQLLFLLTAASATLTWLLRQSLDRMSLHQLE